MERRGRIPVAKFRTQEAKTRSRSRVREPDYNEQDPEHDMFTLLEDNIALKEENKALKLEIETHKTTQEEQQSQHEKLCIQMEALQQQQANFETQIKELGGKFSKALNERNALDKLHKMKVDQIQNLTSELEHMRERQQEQEPSQGPQLVLGSAELKRKLFKILQQGSTDSGDSIGHHDFDSLVDVNADGVPITSGLVERLADEFLSLKNATNAVELQLYEANEKMAELLEHQHSLEEENETLRSENTNLTKVAKLLTENMKESVETSQKMESALIKLKQRNDELTAKTRDLTDGQPGARASLKEEQAEFEQIQDQVQQQAREHNERIVEMQSLVDAAIAKTTNDELKKLQLKLEILEEQLREALTRADLAEEQLANYHKSEAKTAAVAAAPPPPPPPIPPPLPGKLLFAAPTKVGLGLGGDAGGGDAGSFSDHILGHNLRRGSDKIIDNVKHQVQAEAATGLDALVREFKSGGVTLRRRNRRRTGTSEALKEMFQVLEISQKQNRNSKICVDLNLNI
ncbi:shootin-1 isoform X1 [Drosophila subobscura]|uniref:shootin-1 isoform X1 n=1 Tax=Drosophila subobscura TaxID=7241 RepID=UPI00155A2C14|nr:shootin-1 isoform X1 [Drosophila subobscura]XP_034662933.1 shootin-1 isoform X1 [Drosophila subobscura]XP_034662934.1 shootin-1 isoform X1 [Drosophila subobscura]XP_034662935.1 shootin-1 isoform X1 [Drosophila subobscura]XP_034662936.1 shootin-1 isoform X1 [Drosophila subobscura]